MAMRPEQSKLTFASLAGYEPAVLEASTEVIFKDPFDGACVPQLQHVQKKRFPGLATLRRLASKHGYCAERDVNAKQGHQCKTSVDCMDHKDELESAAKAFPREQELSLKSIQGVHLAGAAVLGLRRTLLQETTFTSKKMMMQTCLSDTAEAVTVSKIITVPMVPRPPSAAPRRHATGQGKQPTLSNVQVLIVPVTC